MDHEITRRAFVGRSVALAATTVAAGGGVAQASTPSAVATFENAHLRVSIASDGHVVEFIDKRTDKNYVKPDHPAAFATIKQSGKAFDAHAIACDGQRLLATFGSSGVRAVFKVTSHPNHFVVEVESLEGEVDELRFANIAMTLAGVPDEPFAACALALNLQTNVGPLPGAMSHLAATAFRRFGIVGAQVALIGCPQEMLRQTLKEVVVAAPELPQSPLGGPWALDAPINRGSYLFNFDGVTVGTADAWINCAKSLGMTQIDFHTGKSLRFGDCRPNPKQYPNGYADVRAAIDRLHAAGIKAGLHTYAFFIARDCPWVSPVPDARLAKQATFTLSEPISPDAATVPVDETTEAVSAITGFGVRNSVTLQIDDELITFSEVSKTPPYGLAGCKRGAWGTQAAAHAKGAKVHHLKQCFFLFAPDGESTLFDEVAAKTAEAYNECGFDMIYLDALDGANVLGGAGDWWHYGAKFTYEVCRRLSRPALVEMSTFHHHLWCVRSRFCAWDHPKRSYKAFIDRHCQAQYQQNRRIFMPGELGWWALKCWQGPQVEPTFSDDIEYLMGRCIGTDSGVALMGINPWSATTAPGLPRLAAIIKRYEDLRHSGKVSEAMKTRLRVAGDEYRLLGDVASGWRFQPIRYDQHRVAGPEDHHARWAVENRYAAQPVGLRIESLFSAGPYDAPENVTMADFTDVGEFAAPESAPGVTLRWQPSAEQVKIGSTSGRLTATNTTSTRDATWCKIEKPFSPTIDLDACQALGVWVHGDGQGEVLNIQLTSPAHVSSAVGHHYIDIDFTGWRYFELIEPEGRRVDDYQWPNTHNNYYGIYRNEVVYKNIERLAVWLNHLPAGGTATCYLGPIRAVPLVAAPLVNPSVTVGDRTITFPVEVPLGHYLEHEPGAKAKLYGQSGQLIREVAPQGEPPVAAQGSNQVRFGCQSPDGVHPRARVTLITAGEPLA